MSGQPYKGLNWLQLSDLHLFEEADTTLMKESFKKLAKVISPRFIVVTGDYRHLGYKQASTYAAAKDYLEAIVSYFGIQKDYVYLVPGNHDVTDSLGRDGAISDIVKNMSHKKYGYYDTYATGKRDDFTLDRGFDEYNAFVSSFYEGSNVADARVNNPSGVFVSTVDDLINILHINTALISDKERNADGTRAHPDIVDINQIAKLSSNLDSSIPSIVIGHSGLDDLYPEHKSRLERILRDHHSAYLHGDIHRYRNNPIRLEDPNKVFPSIACGKSCPQDGDDFSDIGAVYYSCKDGNHVEVIAYDCDYDGFHEVTKRPFVFDVNKHFSFPLLFSDKPDADCDDSNGNDIQGFSSDTVRDNQDKSSDMQNGTNCSDKKTNSKGIEGTIDNAVPTTIETDEGSTMAQESIDFADSVAVSVFNSGKYAEFANLILLQEKNNNHSKTARTTFDTLLEWLLASKHNCPLAIWGQPGTGKSTLLSLLYLRLKEHGEYWVHYMDLHCFDEASLNTAKDVLKRNIDFINEKVEQEAKVVLFIDGLNDYIRLKTNQEKILREQIDIWKKRKNVQIVCAIGVHDFDHYPPFTRFNAKSAIVAEKRVTLTSIEVDSPSFRRITESVLSYKDVYKQSSCNTLPQKQKLHTNFYKCCKLIDGNKSTYRTILFLASVYLIKKDEMFTQPVAILLRDYFRSMLTPSRIKKIANEAADFLLNDTSAKKISPWCLKSDAFLDFFFALAYVDFLTKERSEAPSKDEFSKFNCIFTARINRFVVQLMCADSIMEECALYFICGNFDNMPLKAKNQAAYLLGRFNDENIKILASDFLMLKFNKAYKEYAGSDKNNDAVMLLRSMGISLLKLGCRKHEDNFYDLLISDENMSRINRHFHITYYMNGSYKLTDNDVVDNSLVYDFKNIKRTYDFLYHSIEKSENRTRQCVNIITAIDLVLNYAYRSLSEVRNANKFFRNFKTLINKLALDDTIENAIVKSFVVNIAESIDHDDPYTFAFSQIYRLKEQLRRGWLEPNRGINKQKSGTESVADHTWACCMLAQMLLPDNIHDSVLIDKEECSLDSCYNKQKVISLLLVHDLPESITGDVPSPDKTSQDDEKEKTAIAKIGTMSAFPTLSPMKSVVTLWNEYKKLETINARLAYDIDKLEPLIQLYLYRNFLAVPNDYNVAERWVSSIKLKTKFGANLLKLIKLHFINPEAFKK